MEKTGTIEKFRIAKLSKKQVLKLKEYEKEMWVILIAYEESKKSKTPR